MGAPRGKREFYECSLEENDVEVLGGLGLTGSWPRANNAPRQGRSPSRSSWGMGWPMRREWTLCEGVLSKASRTRCNRSVYLIDGSF